MLKLRGGMAAFQIEMGRWHGLTREERVCKECVSGEVENVRHWLLQCSEWNYFRQPLLEAMDGIWEEQKVTTTNQDQSLNNQHITFPPPLVKVYMSRALQSLHRTLLPLWITMWQRSRW